MKLFSKTKKLAERKTLPLIAIRDMVIFPHSTSPIYMQNNTAMQSITRAMRNKSNIILAYYKTKNTHPSLDNLNEYATTVRIAQIMELSNNSSRILLEGIERIRLVKLNELKNSFKAIGEAIILDSKLNSDCIIRMKAIKKNFSDFAKDSDRVSHETLKMVEDSNNPHDLIDRILSQISISYQKKLSFLNNLHTTERLDRLAIELESEKEISTLKTNINRRVKKRMDENHREFVINEQIKELHKELGNENEDTSGIRELEMALEDAILPERVQVKTKEDLKRLRRLQSVSPEASILRGYLEWISSLPWSKHSKERIDLSIASTILDEDHYNMKEPKDRILDFLAILQLKRNLKGPILCFVGPPGTGKTSLCRSLARAMGRDFVRISLGGIRDEAEIRGHRRTYVGALPGKIIQGLKRAGSINPVMLLDEIDKLGTDQRGDPGSALLEVLDPEQNKEFIDNYIEVPVDLSHILFITTANNIHDIPYPLLDRMELIQVPGYTGLEKQKIAENFIIPKQLREHGLEWAHIHFSEESITTIIEGYTRESGVRNLEREIATIIRKIARKALENGEIAIGEQNIDYMGTSFQNKESSEQDSQEVRPSLTDKRRITEVESKTHTQSKIQNFKYRVELEDVKVFLGERRFNLDLFYKDIPPGLAYGMAWTVTGGILLPVETIILNKNGTGEMTLTGSLGDVMKESARIGLSLARKLIEQRLFGIDPCISKKADVHVHVPEGAIPKDGPSAGLTLTTSFLSIFSSQTIRVLTAMTGEVTLTGWILPVGGIKEKVFAAHRNKFKNIILPLGNKKDYKKLPDEVKNSINFIFVENIQDTIEVLFENQKFVPVRNEHEQNMNNPSLPFIDNSNSTAGLQTTALNNKNQQTQCIHIFGKHHPSYKDHI